jgi:DNA-binding transcriptional ArsR family regulator
MSRRAAAENDDALDAVFGALGDPTRRRILVRLAAGPASISELAQPFAMTLPAVSKHLRVLERAGLVRREVRGREHVCTLNAAPLREATRWMDEVRSFWETRLDALDRHIASRRTTR